MTPRLEKIRDELASDRQFPSDCVEFSFGFTAACDILLPLIEECEKALTEIERHKAFIYSELEERMRYQHAAREALSKIKQTHEGE